MKLKLLFLVFFAVFSRLFGNAGEGEYAVSKIAAGLLKNANAVLRSEELRFEIKSTKETILTSHFVITILNEKGDQWADFFEHYNKYRSINDFEGVLYDANGKQLKKIKKKDLVDLSGVSDESLMEDSRIRRHNFYYRVYPYTVEYTVLIENKATLFFPMWSPQRGENLSVESSSITVVSDRDYVVRYKAFGNASEPKIREEKGKKIMTWSAANMNSIIREPFSPMWHELTTIVIFGPSEFQMDDYKGNMRSWQDFGKFVHTLRQGRDQLPPSIKEVVHAIADRLPDPKEKIARLYEYMQKHTRYISIQLGIGGWQPFAASDVAAKGYGDCKALTNYMYSLLQEAGIKSFYAMIRAGKNANYITEDFPSQQFNHVILCVPLSNKDSVWLECTSQTMPAGYLGDFTADRPALLVDESGGKLVRTPKYAMSENVQSRTIKASLEESGTLNIIAKNAYSGMQQDDIHGMINSLSKEKVKEHLQEQFNFATYDINTFDYRENKSEAPVINETLDITVSNYATITGKRLFIVPNVMTRTGSKLSVDTARKYDILLNFEYKDIDSVEILLPAGYTPESMPKDAAIKSRFGQYTTSIRLKENKLFYYRTMEHYSGRFPAAQYGELAEFANAVYKADRTRVVLIKGAKP